MSDILAKIFTFKLRLYSLAFNPINIMILFVIFRILLLIITFVSRNDFNLEFLNYFNSYFDFQNLNFIHYLKIYFNTENILNFVSYINSGLKPIIDLNLVFNLGNWDFLVSISLYYNSSLNPQFEIMDTYMMETPYHSTFAEMLNKVLSGAYWMENNTGKDSSSSNQNLSDIASQALARLNPSNTHQNLSDIANQALAKLNADRFDVSKPHLPQLDLPKSNLVRSDLTRSDLPRPDLARLSMHNLGLPKPSLPRLELLGPSLPRANLLESNIPNVDVPSPSRSSPDLSNSNISSPNIPNIDPASPNLSNISNSESDLARPNLPNSSRSDLSRSDLPISNIPVSNIDTPNIGRPNIGRPNISIPHLPTPNEENRLTFVDSNESFDYSRTYTFTPDEFKNFKSLENKELIRAFDPAYLRKFSGTLRDEDFHKHLNSPTNYKFQNSLANNIRRRMDIVLILHNGNYIEANDDMNKTMNDYKGRVWYKDKPKFYGLVKRSDDPKKIWD